METKICNKCGIEKNIEEFQFRKDTNSYRHACKECLNKQKKILYNKKHEKERMLKELAKKELPKAIKCNKCGVEKDVSNFDLRKDTGRYRNTCKECRRKITNEYYINHKDELLKKHSEYAKKYRIENKEKLSQKSKEYYKNNKEKIKIRHKRNNAKRYLEKKEEILQYSKEYRKSHKEQIRIRINAYEKNRKEKDPLFKLIKQVRTLINGSFSNKGYKKNTKTEKILGCSINYFITYLFETYKANYGAEWDGKEDVHIDHIIPLATANSEEEIIKLCHYTNLQLLKAKDNFEKHDKLNWKLEK